MKRLQLCLLLLCLGCMGAGAQNNQDMSYETKWKEIERLRSQDRLPKSALEKLEELYLLALKDNAYGQVVKAVAFRTNLLGETEEDPSTAILASLKAEAERLPQPARSIIYAYLGDFFSGYYQDNRWTILNRTGVSTNSDDFKTWSAQQLIDEAVRYYMLSIQDEKTLQATPISAYADVITGYSSGRPSYLPTLFDLLGHKALTLLSSAFVGEVRPQDAFIINDPAYFSSPQSFINLRLPDNDPESVKYKSLLIYQRLLSFRFIELANTVERADEAFTDLNLRRLAYVREQGTYGNADKLFEEALRAILTDNPGANSRARITYELAYLYKEQGLGWRNTQTPGHRERLLEAYKLASEISKQQPTAGIASYALALRKEITSPELSLNIDKYQAPNSPILYKATYRNVDKLYFFVYPVSDKWSHIDRYSYKNALKGRKPVAVHEAVTVSQPDYQPYSAEMMLQGLAQGEYTIVATNNPDFLTVENDDNLAIAIANSNIYGLSFLAKNSTGGTMLVYVTDRVTGRPVEGAKVEAYSSTYSSVRNRNLDVLEETVITGKDGTVKVSTITKDYDDIYKLKIAHGDKRVEGAPNAYGYYDGRGNPTRVVFFTDRAIYRPGQTVYFKGLVFDSDSDGENKLLERREVSVQLRDVNHKTIATLNLTSNEFGSIQGTFAIPQGLLNGQMSLSCSYGQHYFSVEEYKRPTFDVTFNPVTETHKLNDEVTVSGIAKALAGYAVDNAKVQYRVQRQVAYRYYRWWWPPITDGSREIASGVLTTDGKGGFAITFTALADDVKNDELVYTYTVSADVTDVNGETRSSNLNLRIGNKPLLVNVGIPETVMAGETLTFPIGTTNLNGEPTPAKVNITVSRLKSPDRILRKRLWAAPDTLAMPRNEFVQHFPFDPYGNEDMPNTYEVQEQVATLSVNTKDSQTLDLSPLRKAASGWYRVDVKARNDSGVEVEQQMFVQLESAKPGPIRTMNSWMKAVKTSGEVGETAVFTVAGGKDRSYVLYELMLKSTTLERRIIEVGKTPQRIEIPIKEAYRGGVGVQLTMIQNNRLYTDLRTVTVPYTNKMLDVAFTTFRDKLQPGEEEKWTITVKNKAGEKEAAEMVATLYDASLDAFVPHSWASFNDFYPVRDYYNLGWRGSAIQTPLSVQNIIYRYGSSRYIPSYEELVIYFNYYYSNVMARALSGSVAGLAVRKSSQRAVLEEEVVMEQSAVAKEAILPPPMGDSDNEQLTYSVIDGNDEYDSGTTQAQLTGIATRRNFNETAFFYPQLRTNEEGEILIEFTIPEALTRWRMLGFAHTKDFKVGTVTNELITQKEVAISANAPRFFRENDRMVFTAKVNNLTEAALGGKAMLRLYDATNMQPVDGQLLKSEQTVSFTVPAEGSTGVSWTLLIPEGIPAVTYKLTAQAGSHTDGEEKIVPVLTNSMLVTETMPFSVRAGQTRDFTFDKLRNQTSTTLRNHRLTLEYTSNPAWNAVLALPYLMEYPYECAEQTFARFYANSLASAVANSSPKIKQIFDQWSAQGSQALLSNLEKNQELKQVMLEETPWVLQAENETERRRRIGVLFDLNRMGNELGRAYNKLSKMQYSNGGIPWFDGMEPSRFVTQHIVAGMAHLDKLNALDKRFDVQSIISRGLSFLDGEIRKDYDNLLSAYSRDRSKDKKPLKEWLAEQSIGSLQVHYLYAAGFSRHKPDNKSHLEAFEYYIGQAEKQWMRLSIYEQAMVSLTLNRYGKTDVAKKITASLKERSQQSEEMGMYWNDNRLGYFWYQAPIETQAMLIETFDEVANDTKSVEEMKIWLLRQRQTTDWRTTKATSEAVYALLMTGSNLLDNDKPLQVQLGGKPLDEVAVEPIRPEAGTGYVKTSWSGGDIKKELGELTATNPNSSGVAWGALYWQYFEQLDKITAAETNLKMKKDLFLKTITPRGEVLEPISEKNVLTVGDVVKVRMELRADRDFEYVHLKDMRAAGFEPVSTVSGYRFQGGLGYYESVKDASVNFFIYYLRKGTYVFEYELRVSHAGDFSNGITTFQCMYAPEFSSHSEGIRVKVE